MKYLSNIVGKAIECIKYINTVFYIILWLFFTHRCIQMCIGTGRHYIESCQYTKGSYFTMV